MARKSNCLSRYEMFTQKWRKEWGSPCENTLLDCGGVHCHDTVSGGDNEPQRIKPPDGRLNCGFYRDWMERGE
jgi:hypothetical protein